MNIAKITIVMTILFYATETKAQTNWFIENRNVLNNQGFNPVFHGLVSHDVNAKWGVWGYFQVKKQWAETFIGGSYNLTKDCQIGIGYGFEQTSPYGRLAGSFFFDKNKNTVFYFGEYGASGYWYQSYASHKFGKKVSLGILGQQSAGYGLKFEIKFSPLVFWTAYCYDPRTTSTNGLLAVRLKF